MEGRRELLTTQGRRQPPHSPRWRGQPRRVCSHTGSNQQNPVSTAQMRGATGAMCHSEWAFAPQGQLAAGLVTVLSALGRWRQRDAAISLLPAYQQTAGASASPHICASTWHCGAQPQDRDSWGSGCAPQGCTRRAGSLRGLLQSNRDGTCCAACRHQLAPGPSRVPPRAAAAPLLRVPCRLLGAGGSPSSLSSSRILPRHARVCGQQATDGDDVAAPAGVVDALLDLAVAGCHRGAL